MRLTARCFDRLNMTSGGTSAPDLEFCMILFSPPKRVWLLQKPAKTIYKVAISTKHRKMTMQILHFC